LANRSFAPEIPRRQGLRPNLPTVARLGMLGAFDFYLRVIVRARTRVRQGRAGITVLRAPARKSGLTGCGPIPAALAAAATHRLSRACAVYWSSPPSTSNPAAAELAPVYATDFIYQDGCFGCCCRRMPPLRMTPEGAGNLLTPPAPTAIMIPWRTSCAPIGSLGAPSLTRFFNGYPAVEITVGNVWDEAPEALQAIQAIVTADCPRGFGHDLAGHRCKELISGAQRRCLSRCRSWCLSVSWRPCTRAEHPGRGAHAVPVASSSTSPHCCAPAE